jgi:hypothetical protein
MLWHALLEHGISERLDHSEAVDAPVHPQGQALARVLVNERQDAQAAPIMGVALNKVEAPHVMGPLGPQPDAGAIMEPQPASGLVPLRNLQPFTAPDALNPIPTHRPACHLRAKAVIRR